MCHAETSGAALLQAPKRARRKIVRGECRERGIGELIVESNVADKATVGLIYATAAADHVAARTCGKTKSFGEFRLYLCGQALADAISGSDTVGGVPSCLRSKRKIGPRRHTANPGLSRS